MTEDLAAFFDLTDGFCETVTVGASSVTAIVDTASVLGLDGNVVAFTRSVLVPAASVPGVAEGTVVTVRSVAHRVRQVLLEPPDGLLLRLELARG